MSDGTRQAAARGRGIVHSSKRHEDGSDRLDDVLADLMHYAEADGRDFEAALERARAYYAVARDEGERRTLRK